MQNAVKWLIGGALAVVIGLVAWWQTKPAPEPEAVVKTVPEPVAVAPEAEPTVQPEAEAPRAPEFDVARISADGQLVVGGHAAPGQLVEILVDDEVIGTVAADATGAFAEVYEIGVSSEARTLAYRTALANEPAAMVTLPPTEAEGEVAAVEAATAEASAAEAAAAELAAAEKAAAAAEEAAAAKAAEAAAAAEEAAAAKAAEAAAERAAAQKAIEAAAAAEKAAEAAAAELAAAADAVATAAGQVTEAVTGATDTPATEATAAAEAAAAAKAEAEAAAASAEVEAAAVKAEAKAAAAKAEAEAAAASAEAEAAAAKAEAEAEAAAALAADPGAGSVEPEVSRYVLSAPVIILPQEGADQAPVLVKPEPEGVVLLQPAQTDPAAGIVLDRITYSPEGDLVAAGRGRPGFLVRVYANASFLEEIRCGENGQWETRIDAKIASEALLLRFDEIDADGAVVSRLETPFEYSPVATTQELRERKIVVQKGDNLWTFAEQHYGHGIRYSVIFGANSGLIRDPDLIYPGQVFSVPELVNSQ